MEACDPNNHLIEFGLIDEKYDQRLYARWCPDDARLRLIILIRSSAGGSLFGAADRISKTTCQLVMMMRLLLPMTKRRPTHASRILTQPRFILMIFGMMGNGNRTAHSLPS